MLAHDLIVSCLGCLLIFGCSIRVIVKEDMNSFFFFNYFVIIIFLSSF